jgi:DNA primase
LLDDAIPLSKFLLNELSSHVDRNTHEGRAKLLQEAKPLVKQITAPMLSLMLRKQLAEVTGITQQELNGEFQIKAPPAAAPARRPPPAQRSIVQSVMELLVLDGALARQADRALLAPGIGLAGIDQHELAALNRLLEILCDDGKPLNVGEFFRGTEYEDLFSAVEVGVLRRQEQSFSGEETGAEFVGAWRQLAESIRKARIKVLLQKSQEHGWSPEEQSQFLLLQQQVTVQPLR